jgi:hypothetical protein
MKKVRDCGCSIRLVVPRTLVLMSFESASTHTHCFCRCIHLSQVFHFHG